MVLILSNGLFAEISAATQNCTGDHSGMTAWTEPASLPTSGTYYLDTDVNISQQTTIDSGDNLTLCLNGHTVKATTISRIFYIKGGSLTLCDCQNNNGKLTGGCTKLSGISADKDGGAVYLDGGSFTMYGGTISGNATAGDASYKGAGGGVYVNYPTGKGSSVNLNGNVNITGNTKTDNTSNNVHINSGSGSILTIGSNFSTNTPIGVSVNAPPTSCANPIAVTNSVSEAVYEKFTSEMGGDSSFSLGFTDGIIQFEIPHDYDTASWTSDGSSHWHKCKTTDCSAKKDEAAHTWNDGLCTICGASDPYIGDGYTFDPDTGKLTVTSNAGTTNWRDNTNIAKNKVMSVEITEQVTAIGDEAFKDCTQIEKIAIPDSVLSIGESTFSGCSALNEVTLPESLTEIKAMTFKNCNSLKSINIPAGVTSIGESAFYSSRLVKVILPKGVTSIGSQAFDACHNLFAVLYPDGASVGENAFYSNRTAQLKYDAEAGGDKYKVTEIVLPDTISDIDVTDDMNIGFVAEDQRSKVSQSYHTHIGGTATCTQKAKCDICNAEYGEIVAHTLTAHAAVSATCTTDGNQAYWTCSGCNKIFSDKDGTTEIDEIPVIPAEHKYGTDWKSDADNHWHECTVCNDKKDIGSHTWNSGTVTTEPTEEAEGVRTYTCTVCSATRTESIDKLNHTHTYSSEWTSDSTSHWHAATCGHDVISGAAAHIEDNGTVTVPATTENEGVKTYACSVCGYVMRTETIDKLPPSHTHSYSMEWKSDADSHWHECDCGEKSELARETIEKLPDGNKGDVVEDVKDTSGTNAGLVQDNTLIENVLTDGDKTEVENGSSFEIVLEVTDIQSSVPAGDVTAASSALRSGENIGIYVDLSLFKIKDKSERTPIYNTSGQIGITLTVPDSIYASGRTYSIIRVHDGKAENLGGIYDKTSCRLTFYTDKFSTYAIVYYENVESGENEALSTPPSGENEAPSTGDIAYAGWLLMLMLVSGGVLAVAGKRYIGEKE